MSRDELAKLARDKYRDVLKICDRIVDDGKIDRMIRSDTDFCSNIINALNSIADQKPFIPKKSQGMSGLNNLPNDPIQFMSFLTQDVILQDAILQSFIARIIKSNQLNVAQTTLLQQLPKDLTVIIAATPGKTVTEAKGTAERGMCSIS